MTKILRSRPLDKYAKLKIVKESELPSDLNEPKKKKEITVRVIKKEEPKDDSSTVILHPSNSEPIPNESGKIDILELPLLKEEKTDGNLEELGGVSGTEKVVSPSLGLNSPGASVMSMSPQSPKMNCDDSVLKESPQKKARGNGTGTDKKKKRKKNIDKDNNPTVMLNEVNMVDIPGVRVVSDTEDNSEIIKGYKRPDKYITWGVKEDLEYEKTVEYDLDSEDETFLEKLNLDNKEKNYNFNEYQIESVIDFLEKESFKQKEYNQLIIAKSIEEYTINDDIPCCICLDKYCPSDDVIVYCDGCNIAVHQDCIGLTKIPEGNWYCDKCIHFKIDKSSNTNKKLSQLDTLKCIICKESGSAMKQTTCGKWIHIVCAIWIPEIHFEGDKVFIGNLSKKRGRLNCVVCGKKGGCIQCSKQNCMIPYHPSCAQNEKYYMNVEEKRNIKYVSYCQNHTIIKQNELLELGKHRDCQVLIGTFIDQMTRSLVEDQVKFKIPMKAFNAICDYWKQKRKYFHRGRFPLIRRLLLETETEKRRDNDELKKLKATFKNYSETEKFRIMNSIRIDLEKSRTIIDLIVRREKTKLLMVKNLMKTFEMKKNQEELIIKLKLPQNFLKDGTIDEDAFT